jgi:CBS domain-containing protein
MKENSFVSYLDISDIIGFIIKGYYETLEKEKDTKFDEYFEKAQKSQIKDVLGDINDPFLSTGPETSLFEICQLFSQNGIERALIKEEKSDELISFITEGDILKFIGKKINNIGSIAKKSVSELKLGKFTNIKTSGKSGVYVIHQNKPAIEAFKKIKSKNLKGLGIVNDYQVLVGNISASDLKHIKKDQIHDVLSKNCLEFNTMIKEMNNSVKPINNKGKKTNYLM